MERRKNYKLGGVFFAFCSLIMIILILDLVLSRTNQLEDDEAQYIYSQMIHAMKYDADLSPNEFYLYAQEYKSALYEIANDKQGIYSRNFRKLCLEEYKTIDNLLKLTTQNSSDDVERAYPVIYSSTARIVNHPTLKPQREKIYYITNTHQSVNY